MIRFLRCFAAFRRLEDDLTEARMTVGIERELRLKAEAEAQRMWSAYEETYKGEREAMKMLANVSVQVHIGCQPPYPDVWHLPARKPKPANYEPIETGRVSPNDVMNQAKESFISDITEFFSRQQ